jgi:hypothetical protein
MSWLPPCIQDHSYKDFSRIRAEALSVDRGATYKDVVTGAELDADSIPMDIKQPHSCCFLLYTPQNLSNSFPVPHWYEQLAFQFLNPSLYSHTRCILAHTRQLMHDSPRTQDDPPRQYKICSAVLASKLAGNNPYPSLKHAISMSLNTSGLTSSDIYTTDGLGLPDTLFTGTRNGSATLALDTKDSHGSKILGKLDTCVDATQPGPSDISQGTEKGIHGSSNRAPGTCIRRSLEKPGRHGRVRGYQGSRIWL